MMQQLSVATREVEADEIIVAGRRKSSLSQEQQWLKIDMCDLGERRKKRKSKGRKMAIYENQDIYNDAFYYYCFNSTVDKITC